MTVPASTGEQLESLFDKGDVLQTNIAANARGFGGTRVGLDIWRAFTSDFVLAETSVRSP